VRYIDTLFAPAGRHFLREKSHGPSLAAISDEIELDGELVDVL
jgi:hypothetical protein